MLRRVTRCSLGASHLAFRDAVLRIATAADQAAPSASSRSPAASQLRAPLHQHRCFGEIASTQSAKGHDPRASLQGVISASLFGSEHLPLLRLPHDNTALSAFTPPPAPRILVEVFKDEGTDEVERYAIQCLQEARGVLNEGSKRPVDIIRAMSKFSHLMLRRQELASIEGSEVQKQAIDFLRALADQLAPITRRSRSRTE